MFTLNDVLQDNADKVSLLSDQSPNLAMIFRSAHHDSRQISTGDLFVALKGARVDGHRFISTVAQAGALGALCSEPASDVPPGFLQIVVPDVVEALHATARVRTRRQEHTTLIGITGSDGIAILNYHENLTGAFLRCVILSLTLAILCTTRRPGFKRLCTQSRTPRRI